MFTTVPASSRSFLVLQHKLPELMERMGKLAKRAAKLGVEPPTVKVVGEPQAARREDPNGHMISVVVVPVEVQGQAPVLPGWGLVGVINVIEGEGILKSLPDTFLPESFKHVDPMQCDHCNTRRQRNDTFILQSEDGTTFKQVGRQCLKDFLPGGHTSPDALAWWAYAIDAAMDACRSAGEYEGGGNNPHYIGLDIFLGHVAQEIRENGWVSRTEAYNRDCSATADIAMGRMTSMTQKYTPSPTDIALAERAIEWAAALSDNQTEGNEFMHNIRVLARLGVVDHRTYRIAAAMVSSFSREETQRQQSASLKPVAERGYEGTVGKNCIFNNAIVLGLPITFNGSYGTSFIYRVSVKGNLVCWFSSKDLNLAPGTVVTVKGVVKAHEIYTPRNGRGEVTAQTVITRAVVG